MAHPTLLGTSARRANTDLSTVMNHLALSPGERQAFNEVIEVLDQVAAGRGAREEDDNAQLA